MTDQVVAPVAPVAPVLSEHDAAMVAKLRASQAPKPVAGAPAAPVEPVVTPVATRPDNVPEKFWDAATGTLNTAALLKSQADAEAALRALQQGKTPAVETPPADGTQPKTPPAPEATVPATAMAAFSAEYAKDGQLSEASYTTLAEKHGVSKDMVDAYIAGQVALASSSEARIFSIAGGNEQYGKMLDWASANMTASEIAAYDKAVVTSGEAAELAVRGLKARFVEANGRSPGVKLGGSGGQAGAEGYASRAEMTTDMKDPRYSKDPAYRAKVQEKLRNKTY